MKNKLLLFLVVVILGVLPFISFAETSTPKTIKSEIEAKKEAIKNSVEERRQNAVDKIKERVDKFIQNMIERFDAANNRLARLADRIDSRITKMEANKIDVTKAKELLVIARTKIETARANIALITMPVVTSSTASTTVAGIKKDFESIKIQIEKVKADIKLAHTALVDVVENLKPGQNKTEN